MKWNELDLKIELSPSQSVVMQGMIEKFLVRKQHYFCEPVLEKNLFRINSSDFINFLDQAKFGNEFDRYRLKSAAVKAIAKARMTKKAALVIQHYKRCEEIVREL